VRAALRLADVRDLAPAVARCRRLFDLDADPEASDGVLAADPSLAGVVAAEPGVRVPRAVDGFEMAVRAVVGQQVSMRAARTVLARLVAATGRSEPGPAQPDPGPAQPAQPDPAPTAAFPTAEELLELPDEAYPMPVCRRGTLRSLAAAVADGTLDLDGGADRAETRSRLLALPGVGAWTADYLALRALGDPDALLGTDLGVRRGARALGLPDDPSSLTAHAEAWRPWRSYAVIRLWRSA
jgi:AraC family transcriptional regulator of adaptative response / DNA-3-methyladenine glycosylase II